MLGTKRLFKMTSKRSRALDRLSFKLAQKVEFLTNWYEDDLAVAEETKCEETYGRAVKAFDGIERYTHAHDVIQAVMYHGNPDIVHLWYMAPRDWRSEWDIEDDEFESAMNDVLALIDEYEEHGVDGDRYVVMRDVIEDLTTYRLG